MKRILILIAALATSGLAHASNDYLVKMAPGKSSRLQLQSLLPEGSKVERLGFNDWHRVQIPAESMNVFRVQALMQNKGVMYAQPNYKLYPSVSPSLAKARALAKVRNVGLAAKPAATSGPDNVDFPSNGSGGTGSDPMFTKQWGMNQNNVKGAWEKTRGSETMIVAVLDTGVDYAHEDLVDNMWKNPGETGVDAKGVDKSKNGVDDDSNGYIDDIVGWDFSSKDNKPYDKHAKDFLEIINGGNPGHGTHCAGNVAARADNGKGIAGVAPNVKIMALRFISDEGGSSADAVMAIKYAVDNGAKVTSNSWGSEGEDPNDPDSKILREAIDYAQSKGVLFVAAAGNGHSGRGYNNDTDGRPAVPASYTNDNIISVAAINEPGALGSFSNWGLKSVDLAAPGVKVYSTIPQGRYQDTIGSFLGQTITWDGTSMAAPHVAGAAALYWSAHPEKDFRQVKEAIISSVKKTTTMNGKSVSGGQLDVNNLLKQ